MMSVDARSARFAVATATTVATGVTTAAGTTATGATGAITTTTGNATSRPSSRSRRRQQPAAAFQRPVADYPLGRIGSCLRPGMVRGPGPFIVNFFYT